MSAPLPPFRLVDAVRPSAPTPPVDLRLIPVSRLTKREQHFRCEPYHCTLTAGACVDRQAQRVFVHSSGGSKVRYLACQDCAVGARIAKRVPAEAKTLRQNAETKHVSKLEAQRRRALWG